MLRRVKNEGLKLIGITDSGSVADHTIRAAQIGYILSKLEKYDNSNEVCTILIFSNLAETRIGNIHRVANRYLKVDRENVIKEQVEKLENIGKEIFNLWIQVEKRNTKAGIIAKDAKILEHAVIAKEYLEKWFKEAQNWIDNCVMFMQTESGRKLIKLLQKTNSNEWWKWLKKFNYEPPKK